MFRFNFLVDRFLLLTTIVFLVLISACGLKYTPTESPEVFEQRRHTAVEEYIRKEISTQELEYNSVAFGETQFLKPASYKKLDSLYAIKYKNEEIGKLDQELDQKIDNQRMIALNDTNKVIYIEDHVFSLGKGDQVEFYSALFQLGNDLSMQDMIIQESVFLPKKYSELYKQYLFGESFLYPGYVANSEEQTFYTMYKTPIAGMSKSEKDAFILHTLNLMETANKKASLKTETLIKALIIYKYHGNTYAGFKSTFSKLEIFYNDPLKPKEISGYAIVYSYTLKDSTTTISVRLEYDRFLRLIGEKQII